MVVSSYVSPGLPKHFPSSETVQACKKDQVYSKRGAAGLWGWLVELACGGLACGAGLWGWLVEVWLVEVWLVGLACGADLCGWLAGLACGAG